jgi:hypothetical protein
VQGVVPLKIVTGCLVAFATVASAVFLLIYSESPRGLEVLAQKNMQDIKDTLDVATAEHSLGDLAANSA